MRYHKLKAGECPGTYVVTEPVTEQDLLRIANQIARKRLAKGSAITSTVNQHRKMTRVQRPKLTRVSWLISSSV